MDISVKTATHSYTVTVRRGILHEAHKYCNLNRKVLVVTDDGVPAAYAATVAKQCKDAVIVTLPQGEATKCMAQFAYLCTVMLENGFTRTDCVVAVGGGVVGDLAGFAASAFMRGIDFYNIPTTVLSQVDSSIGGKVAIDHNGIKNCIGAFHQPKAVLVDPDLLATLPARHIANGLAEAVKMALTFDAELFELMETASPINHIEDIICACLRIKAQVVEQDEKESGLRRVLNFGHTLGHGIETAAAPNLLHGECVAIGMLPMCAPAVQKRLQAVLDALGLPSHTDVDADAVWEALSHDKKLSGNDIHAVFVPAVGSYEMRLLPLEELRTLFYNALKGM